MPDGTVPSSTEALRAALSAAQASLETQLRTARTDAAALALQQVQSALLLLPGDRGPLISDAEWVEADSLDSTTASLIQPAAKPTETRDDLTRIRGIDAVLARRLAAIGIQRFAQIAAWETDDVRVIADAMGLGRRFLAMGVVEQAADLEQHRLATAARAAKPAPAERPRNTTAVAVWDPKPAVPTSTTALVAATSTGWRPLAGDDLKRAIHTIRTRRPQNQLVTLNSLVPALGAPIYIATDHDIAIELPRWRTGVLVPFVEPPEAPDLMKFGTRSNAKPTDKPPPPRTIIVSSPLPVARPQAAVTAPIRPPLHEEATHRIADLEAEIDDFVVRRSEPAPLPVVTPLDRPAPRIAAPAQDQKRTPAVGIPDDAEEADVKIVTNGRPRPALLAPLPALPLQPAKAPAPDRRDVTARPSMSPVEEAAVVIVRRQTPEPAAGTLAFYATAKSKRPGPMRRFMRALGGA